MQEYKILIDVDALEDIQDAVDWYNEQLPKLGSRFLRQVKREINSLKNSAGTYAIRYGDVRCVLVKRFPFLIHFTLDKKQKTVQVFAVLHMSRNPKILSKRRGGI